MRHVWYRRACIDAPSADGRRALHLAAESRSEERGAQTVAQLLARGADVHVRSNDGRTALHSAAVAGRLGAAKALVLHGADVAARDGGGQTPVDAANCASQDVCCRAPGADWGGVVALIERVAPLELDERRAFAQKTWELHVTRALQDAVCDAAAGELGELPTLLECFGRDVDARDHDGTAAVHAAALCGHAQAVALLVLHSADVHARSNLGETPLALAAREGHVGTTRLLVSSGADVHARTASGATPRELAERHRRREWEEVAAHLAERERAVGLL